MSILLLIAILYTGRIIYLRKFNLRKTGADEVVSK
jgi:hypothetical protein